MQTYKRNITLQLFFLRLTFFVVVLSLFFLFWNGYSDYGFVLLFLLACGSPFPVTSISIGKIELRIEQYYCYGLFLKCRKVVKGDTIKLIPSDITLSDSGYGYGDDWTALLLSFIPSKEIPIVNYTILMNSSGEEIRVKLKLSREEIAHIQDLVRTTEPCP